MGKVKFARNPVIPVKPVDNRELKESDFKFQWKSETVLNCFFKGKFFSHYVVTKVPVFLKVHIAPDDVVEFKIKEDKKIIFITKLL